MQEKINISCTVKKGAIVPEYKTAGAAGAAVQPASSMAAAGRALIN